MQYRIDYRGYRRRLVRPLATGAGEWRVREGLLLKLVDENGRVGYGEVAPLRRKGCETLPAARAFLRGLDGRVADESIDGVPRDLPCCRFALTAARWMMTDPDVEFDLPNAALLPGGELAILGLERALADGFTTFKFKIGAVGRAEETAIVRQILAGLPEGAELRLDANGALDKVGLRAWLEFLAGRKGMDFLEQPLPVGMEEQAAEIGDEFRTELALDESVTTHGQLVAVVSSRQWTGPMVLKPAVFGSATDLERLTAPLNNRLIISSAFETGVGLYAALRTAALLGVEDAVGFGTLAWFDDGLGGVADGARFSSKDFNAAAVADLWERTRKH